MPAAIGYSGVSASGWEIRQAGADKLPFQKEIASRNANRREWAARIMAVKGVVEFLPHKTSATIRMNDRVFIDAVNKGFQRSNGDPMAGEEFWRPMLDLLREKDASIVAELADKEDETMKRVIERTQWAARERIEKLGEKEALANAVPPKPKNAGVIVEPIEGGYQEKAVAIRRKSVVDY